MQYRPLSPLVLLCLAFLALAALPVALGAGRDFYKILGLERSASDRAIKKAYRTMSKLYHPDKNKGDEEAGKRFVDIAAAYETLSDKEKRRVYDQGGEEALKQQQGQGGGGRDPFDLFSNFGGFGGFGHGHGHGHQSQEERRGADVHLDLDVTLEDLYRGRVYEVQLRQQHLCSACRGTGARKESDVHKCGVCQGRGVVIKMHQIGPGFMQQVQQPCDACQGAGKVIKHKCPACRGAKVSKGQTKKLDVMVEMGMPDGHRIEFEHAADEHPDHAAGHVVFTVHTQPHARFRRQGNDLHATQTITLLESLVGFTRTIEHLDGHTVTLSSTGVTQHGDVQRLAKEGMPLHHQASQKGDLYVTYHVAFPPALTAEQKAGFEKILAK